MQPVEALWPARSLQVAGQEVGCGRGCGHGCEQVAFPTRSAGVFSCCGSQSPFSVLRPGPDHTSSHPCSYSQFEGNWERLENEVRPLNAFCLNFSPTYALQRGRFTPKKHVLRIRCDGHALECERMPTCASPAPPRAGGTGYTHPVPTTQLLLSNGGHRWSQSHRLEADGSSVCVKGYEGKEAVKAGGGWARLSCGGQPSLAGLVQSGCHVARAGAAAGGGAQKEEQAQ